MFSIISVYNMLGNFHKIKSFAYPVTRQIKTIDGYDQQKFTVY